MRLFISTPSSSPSPSSSLSPSSITILLSRLTFSHAHLISSSSHPLSIAWPHLRSSLTLHHPSSRWRTSQGENQPSTSRCKSSSPTSIPAQEAPRSQPITSPSSPPSLYVDLLLHRHSQRVHLILLVSGADSTPRQHSFAAIHPPPSSLHLATGLAQN